MTYDDLITVFKKQSVAAKALGFPQSTIAVWKHRGGRIPIIAQLQIEQATRRKLKADPIPERAA